MIHDLPAPSRETDARLHESLLGHVLRLKSGMFMDGGLPVPKYTASLDAATALVKHFLPGCRWSLSEGPGDIVAELDPDGAPGLKMAFAPGRPASALVCLLLQIRAADGSAPVAGTSGLEALARADDPHAALKAAEQAG